MHSCPFVSLLGATTVRTPTPWYLGVIPMMIANLLVYPSLPREEMSPEQVNRVPGAMLCKRKLAKHDGPVLMPNTGWEIGACPIGKPDSVRSSRKQCKVARYSCCEIKLACHQGDRLLGSLPLLLISSGARS